MCLDLRSNSERLHYGAERLLCVTTVSLLLIFPNVGAPSPDLSTLSSATGNAPIH